MQAWANGSARGVRKVMAGQTQFRTWRFEFSATASRTPYSGSNRQRNETAPGYVPPNAVKCHSFGKPEWWPPASLFILASSGHRCPGGGKGRKDQNQIGPQRPFAISVVDARVADGHKQPRPAPWCEGHPHFDSRILLWSAPSTAPFEPQARCLLPLGFLPQWWGPLRPRFHDPAPAP